MKAIITWIVVLAILVGGAWYLFFSNNILVSEGSIIAVVNGEEITQNDLDRLKSQLITQQGISAKSLTQEQDLQFNTQTVNSLISQKILEQAVRSSGITPTSAEVDTSLASIKSRFENEEAYQTELKDQGITERDLRDQVTLEIAVQTYLERELNLSSITVTEEEVEARYKLASQTQELPPLEEIYDQVEATVLQEKQQELINNHILELGSDADIEVLI